MRPLALVELQSSPFTIGLADHAEDYTFLTYLMLDVYHNMTKLTST
jgi:hypothetical protein